MLGRQFLMLLCLKLHRGEKDLRSTRPKSTQPGTTQFQSLLANFNCACTDLLFILTHANEVGRTV
jgi:hypothetical protein